MDVHDHPPTFGEPVSDESQQIGMDWSTSQGDVLEDRCIHQLFDAQVERSPDVQAVVYQDTCLTYDELNRLANQLAHHLQRLGVGPETLVGLCVERSPEMIIGVLGILKAGGAYVPLDPTYPAERLSFMLSDARVPVLLTQERLRGKIPLATHEMETVYLDRDRNTIGLERDDNPPSNTVAENAAYVIYTSGSTGTPKGVVIQHRSLVNYTKVAAEEYVLKPDDRVLQFAPLSFDTSAEEIFPCLTSGATLVLRTNMMLDSISFFLQKCQDWAITVLDLPTAYWHELTRKIAEEENVFPSSVRLVVIGGEKALPEMVTRWQDHIGQRVQLINTYGPTEATIVTTMYKIPGAASENIPSREVPIGRPIPNTQVYVLDQHLQVVPMGVPGELYIGGVGLAREYLNRPALTREKFISHLLRDEPEARLYKTGDLVRSLPTGDIEFLGRVDHQVKIRGYRIELGEIESVLEKHVDVRDTVVQVHEDTSGGKRLIAYVVPQAEQSLTSSSLRRFMQDRLPDYMVPATFMLLDALPMTPSGKVDRRALPVSESIRPELAVAFIEPRDAVQQQLVRIWEELLDVRPIGIRDNFFDLGGHSLLAVRLVDRIEQVWGKKITATTLINGATIEQLAEVLTQPEGAISKTTSEAPQIDDSKRLFFSRKGKSAFSIKSIWANVTGRRQA